MKNKTVPAPPVNEITPAVFAERYQKLCEDTGFQIMFRPEWKQSVDAGDFRLIITAVIMPMPKAA
jgi:hypothetical protein